MLPADEGRRPAARSTPGGDAADTDAERRRSGTRTRARDRIMDRATRAYPPSEALNQVRGLENLILFIDDDLRETALSMQKIEGYLVSALGLLESPKLSRDQVQTIASDTEVLDHVDQLVETLESLRRRLARLASSLR
ncbi:MAG: hypothetical protein IPK80_09520 [Nannocystis sp.]|jgi:hypothetical protein|nr:hypothetical protein [Nannocystis sp.]